MIVSTFLKYVLSMVDNYMEGRWEHKGVYVFYLELVTDMLHLLVYIVFFVIVFTNYGLPLHLVRETILQIQPILYDLQSVQQPTHFLPRSSLQSAHDTSATAIVAVSRSSLC